MGAPATAYDEKKETCGTVCLKYLLFTFNFLFWLAGGVVMAVGIWTLVEKSDYISLLSSATYAASAYILILAGAIVMVTGVLGCCATFKEQRRLLRVYFVLLLCIFLLEILAGVLAYIYYQQLNEELKQNLRETMVQKYRQPEQEHVTKAVDKLQHEFKCCGSNSSSDWGESVWIRTSEADGRLVPDSCCKTQTLNCGRRDHPSNIYKVEGGCITKLENFILDHLKIIGAVGVGIACVQLKADDSASLPCVIEGESGGESGKAVGAEHIRFYLSPPTPIAGCHRRLASARSARCSARTDAIPRASGNPHLHHCASATQNTGRAACCPLATLGG